jgi:hypothetical protein
MQFVTYFPKTVTSTCTWVISHTASKCTNITWRFDKSRRLSYLVIWTHYFGTEKDEIWRIFTVILLMNELARSDTSKASLSDSVLWVIMKTVYIYRYKKCNNFVTCCINKYEKSRMQTCKQFYRLSMKKNQFFCCYCLFFAFVVLFLSIKYMFLITLSDYSKRIIRLQMASTYWYSTATIRKQRATTTRFSYFFKCTHSFPCFE